MTAIKDSHLENQSFWQHDYGHYSPNAALTQNLNADVAIIGGGFTGLNTAWQFKKDKLIPKLNNNSLNGDSILDIDQY